MIHELRITGLGVIAEATARFDSGFTAVTGETGAGKTMVVTGLGVLAGGRADPGLVRQGSANAAVEGTFDCSAELAARVAAAGGEVDAEDGAPALVAARLVAARGRSVLGGRTVPTAVLADVMGDLLVIHGQHDQGRIGRRAAELLDSYAGNGELRQRMAAEHTRLRSLTGQLDALTRSELERARELDTLTHSLDEIAAVSPVPGEDLALAAESERLAHAETLVAAVRAARQSLASDEVDDAPDAMALIQVARRSLDSAAVHDPDLAEHASSLRSVMAALGDVASELSAYAADIDADPHRLDVVQQRQADLTRLTRKYGRDLTEVLSWASDAASRVAELTSADDQILALTAQLEVARESAGALAGQLRARRLAAAERFSAEVSGELVALAMPRARVAFEVGTVADPAGITVPGLSQPVALGATGVDQVTLMLAANPGAGLRPIAQAASGGELSRVMLAIHVVLAGAEPLPTMIFDEVDAGVGGAAAIEVGRRLQDLSRATQVIVVTHLAQVAAFADRQLVVTKDSSGKVTSSTIREVSGQDRVRELSRMLGGLEQSQAAGEHARELLELARVPV